MSFTDKDLHAAVTAGFINERQAAQILALAQERAGKRAETESKEEPFELFRGFNEVFIVVGLTVLYGGWIGITGLNIFFARITGDSGGLLLAALGLAGVAVAARYFTLTRKMLAPSNALTIMAALSGAQVASLLAGELGLYQDGATTFTFAALSLILLGWYWMFRIPFAIALLALSVFATALSFTVYQGAEIEEFTDLFLLSSAGPFAWITFALGLFGFAIAMRFDMSDPHRVTQRSAAGFWLHIISAPAIVNTIALTLLELGGGLALGALIAVLIVLAIVAIIIDRRSFLVAGVGYTVSLAFLLASGDAALWTIFALGAILVLMGAQWERLRGGIMRALPSFPGKYSLPPYQAETP